MDDSKFWCVGIHKFSTAWCPIFCRRPGAGCLLRRSNPDRFGYLAVPYLLRCRQGPSMRMVPPHYLWHRSHYPLVFIQWPLATTLFSFYGSELQARFICMNIFGSASLQVASPDRQERWAHHLLSLASLAQVWRTQTPCEGSGARIVKSGASPILTMPE